jgi:translocation and assembly module TamB
VPVEADLHDLATDITFHSLLSRYQGTLSYHTGQLRYGEFEPCTHTLAVKFAATPSAFSLQSAVLTVAASTMTLQAELVNYANPVLSGAYDLRAHTQDFARMKMKMKMPIRTEGNVSVTGGFRLPAGDGRPWWRRASIDGQIRSDDLLAAAADGRLELRRVQGKFRLENASLRGEDIAAELFGGRMDGAISIEHLDQTPKGRFRVALHDLSLQAAQQSVARTEANRVALAGDVGGTVDGTWSGSIQNIRARSDLSIRAATSKSRQSRVSVPIDGAIHAAYDAPSQTLTLQQTALRIPSTSLTAEGRINKNSRLQVHVACGDLQQLAMLASAFGSSPGTPPVVSGSATLDTTVQGTLARLQISGQASAQDLGVQGSEWKTARLSFQADPSRIIVSNGALTSAQRGAASFAATIALHDWSYLPANPIQAQLGIRQMPVTELEHLAGVEYPVGGELSANLAFSGSQLDPGGSGAIEIKSARIYDQPVQTLAAKFHAGSGSLVSNLNIVSDAGTARADLTFTPRTKAYRVQFAAPSIEIEKLHAVSTRSLNVKGTLSASIDGTGTLDDPQLTAAIRVPKLDLGQKSITGINAEVRVAGGGADLSLSSQVAQASVQAHAHVVLSGDYETGVSIDTGAVPLDVLLATYAGAAPQGFQGQTEFHARLKGPLKDTSKIEAHLTIPTLTASYQTLNLEATAPIQVDYAHSVATLEPAEIRGTGTSVRIQGSIPIEGRGAADLTAQGSIDARILRIVSPDLRSSGMVALDVHGSGSAGSPEIHGQIRLQNVALAAAGAPLSVDKLNGILDLVNDRVQISSLTAEVGGGQISAGGSVAYRPGLQFNVAVQGNSVRLRYPDGLRTVLDTNLTWSGNLQGSTLNGRVLIGALSFTPDFDLASFGDQFSANASAPAPPGYADQVSLQIAVQSKDNLSATSSQLSLEGSANLRVTGTAANPVITGRTDLTAGELFYRNVRYQLQRGIITFENPNQTSPVLNVSVSSTVEQYNLTLNLRGPFDMLTTSYVSDPPLATADIINLIARGKTSSELAASSQSTDSMIASQAASQVSGGVQKLAGISSLQIDPLLGGNNQNPSARVAIQQRVSKNFLFTFSTDVSQPGSEIVQGDYQINKRWSVSVARDQVGGVSIDGRFHTKF